MAHKRALEALDRTMKDLRNSARRFGGAMILLAGDFRQIGNPSINARRRTQRLPEIVVFVAIRKETAVDDEHASCVAEGSISR